NNLYLSGQGTNSAMAIVDLTNVSAPTYTVYPTPGGSRGVAVAGNVAAFGDGTSGVTFLDVTNPASAQLLGSQPVGGMTWDVAISGGRIYAAVEQGVAVINGLVTPPVVDATRLSVAHTSPSSATVSGSPFAVTGAATPMTVQVTNQS